MSLILKRSILLALIACLFWLPALPAKSAASAVSAALYVDTELPGGDYINRGLNELLRFKLNALFMGSVVQTGSDVLAALAADGTTSAETSPTALESYALHNRTDYVFLLYLHPSEARLEVKLYSLAAHKLTINQSLGYEPPDENASLWQKATLTYDHIKQALDTIWPQLEETIKKQGS